MKMPFGLCRPRSIRLRTIAACLAILPALWVGAITLASSSSQPAHLSDAAICQQALTLAATFGEPCQIRLSPVQFGKSYWYVVCQSNDQQFYMSLDETTGRLCQLQVVGRGNPRRVAPIQTALQAREVGLHRLAELQVLPPASRLLLERPPHQTPSFLWQMVWRVHSSEAPHPYRITMMLDRDTGVPVYIWKGFQVYRGMDRQAG